MRCALVLMGGQNGQAVAVEVFVLCAIITVAGVWSFLDVPRSGQGVPRSSAYRTVGSVACYTAEMLGAATLFLGSGQLNHAPPGSRSETPCHMRGLTTSWRTSAPVLPADGETSRMVQLVPRDALQTAACQGPELQRKHARGVCERVAVPRGPDGCDRGAVLGWPRAGVCRSYRRPGPAGVLPCCLHSAGCLRALLPRIRVAEAEPRSDP